MSNDEAKAAMVEGLEMLGTWSRMIAMLPLEEWQRAFDRAETIAPMLDPTLYREYLYSGNGPIIKGLIAAALPLKRFVIAQQPKLAAMLPASAADGGNGK